MGNKAIWGTTGSRSRIACLVHEYLQTAFIQGSCSGKKDDGIMLTTCCSCLNGLEWPGKHELFPDNFFFQAIIPCLVLSSLIAGVMVSPDLWLSVLTTFPREDQTDH